MGANYCHFTKDMRITLARLLRDGCSKSKIADILGVHRSTIYREIRRNSCRVPRETVTSRLVSYLPTKAQTKYRERRKRYWKLLKDKALHDYVHKRLMQGWSPWQIEWRLKMENGGRCQISHETIYRYIYSDIDIRRRYTKKLRRQHKYRVKRNSRKPRIAKELSIHNRPEAVNNRELFGHWECDLMMFKHKYKANLITLRERKSRLMIAIKNIGKYARTTAINIISTLTPLKAWISSITFDQGSEFMYHELIKDCLATDIYFCDPASPEQKGAIENGNGVIRSLLPRHFDIDALTQAKVSEIISEINGRPLQCLDYQTPSELFAFYTRGPELAYEN